MSQSKQIINFIGKTIFFRAACQPRQNRNFPPFFTFLEATNWLNYNKGISSRAKLHLLFPERIFSFRITLESLFQKKTFPLHELTAIRVTLYAIPSFWSFLFINLIWVKEM